MGRASGFALLLLVAASLASPGAEGRGTRKPAVETAPTIDDDAELCEAPAPAPPLEAEVVLEQLAAAGRHWRISTPHGPVHVWTPAGYDAKTAATIIFVHGYHTDVDGAWSDDRLEEQFALANVNAMFVAPAAPSGKRAPVEWTSLDALMQTVTAGVDVPMPTQRVVAVGHSGAYRTLAMWLSNIRLDTVVLLDAVYREYSFAPWVMAAPDHRLINIAYETRRYSDFMHKRLPETTYVSGLPLDGFPDGRIIYARTFDGHYPLVTDGIALPLALRAVQLPRVMTTDLPLGLQPMCKLERTDERDDQQHQVAKDEESDVTHGTR